MPPNHTGDPSSFTPSVHSINNTTFIEEVESMNDTLLLDVTAPVPATTNLAAPNHDKSDRSATLATDHGTPPNPGNDHKNDTLLNLNFDTLQIEDEDKAKNKVLSSDPDDLLNLKFDTLLVKDDDQAKDNALESPDSDHSANLDTPDQINATALNIAYEALEIMRKANLEIEFGHPIDFDCCVHCLRGRSPRKRVLNTSIFAHPKRAHKPCLMCGSPTCQRHASRTFRKSKITICSRCDPLFSPNFVLEFVNAEDEDTRKEMIGRMVDVYDRVLLMLKFSMQFIDGIVQKLENSSKRNDRVGISGTSSGLLSGIAGIAAAAAILTPAGPPLLIASLLFGGTAQACHAGTKTVNYYSTPRRLATKIIAYYNLCKSVLFVTCVLRDALVKDRLNLENYVENYVENFLKGVEDMKGDYGYGVLDNCVSVSVDDEDENTTWNAFPEDQSSSDNSTISADTMPSTIASTVPSTAQSKNVSLETTASSEAAPTGDILPSFCPINLDDRFSTAPSGELLQSIGAVNMLFSEPLTSQSQESGTPAELLPVAFLNSKVEDRTAHYSDIDAFDPIDTLPEEEVDPKYYALPVVTDIEEESTEDTKKTSADNPSEPGNSDVTTVTPAGETKYVASARYLSRTSLASSGLAGVANAAVVAGGALSIVQVAVEAKSFVNTFKRLQKGSPCTKANTLRMIKEELVNFPSTSVVSQEWEKSLASLADRKETIGMAEI